MPHCSFWSHISFIYWVKPDSLRIILAEQTVQTICASRGTVIHILRLPQNALLETGVLFEPALHSLYSLAPWCCRYFKLASILYISWSHEIFLAIIFPATVHTTVGHSFQVAMVFKMPSIKSKLLGIPGCSLPSDPLTISSSLHVTSIYLFST